LVGRVDKLKPSRTKGHWKSSGIDLSLILTPPRARDGAAVRWDGQKRAGVGDVLDKRILANCQPALERSEKVRLDLEIRNTDRAVGAYLSGQLARMHGARGLPTTRSC